ncbi:hypothetical protein Hanom_Chr12g01179191 [Helianthus anomalus]
MQRKLSLLIGTQQSSLHKKGKISHNNRWKVCIQRETDILNYLKLQTSKTYWNK